MEFKERKDWWWVLGGVVLIALLIAALVLNFNVNNLPTSDISDIKIDNGDEKIVWEEYPSYNVELTENYMITAPGTYYLSGKIENGGITVRVVENAAVRLVLNNVTIKNPTGPAIACFEGDDLVIVVEGEDNYLEDAFNYDSTYDEDVKGVIYSKADLSFSGSGKLTVKANYQDGIISKDDLKFSGGTYNIVAVDDGIRGKDSVYITGGDFSITTKGDAIKSTKENDNAKGFLLIRGGKIKISSGDDAIHAYNKLIVEGGEIEVLQSYEGLEAQKVIINGGDIRIASNDDGINAGGGSDAATSKRPGAFDVNENCELVVNGGKLYINAAGDGVDSNGYIYFNGGEVIVDGPTTDGNGALDAGAKIVMNGGRVIAVGASGMAEGLGTESAIYNTSIYFTSTLPKNTKVEIKDNEGNVIISHTSAKIFSHLAAGSAEFKLGETYIIYINDTEYQSFTISSILTTVGRNMQEGPGGPGGGPGMPGGPRR